MKITYTRNIQQWDDDTSLRNRCFQLINVILRWKRTIFLLILMKRIYETAKQTLYYMETKKATDKIKIIFQ